MNFSNEAWALEFDDGTQMSGLRSEHIKEAAAVVSQYCDIIAIRAFASLNDKESDEAEKVLQNFTNYYRDSMKAISMEKVIADRRDILKQELTKIGRTTL